MNIQQKTTKGAILIAMVLMASATMAQTVADGLRMLDLEQYKKAKNIFLALTKKEPANARNFFYAGETYFTMGILDSADICYKKGIEADPKDAFNYVGTGKVFLQKNNLEAATEQFKKGMGNAGKDGIFYALLGEAWSICALTNFENAEKYFTKSKDIQESNPDLYIKWGNMVLVKEKDGGKANSQYNQAIYYDKNFAKAYYKIGAVYRRGKVVNNAIESYKKAIDIDSNFIPAYRELGELYLMAKKYELAVYCYKKYIDKSDKEPNDLIRYVAMLFYNKNYDEANKIISPLVINDPNNTNILRLLAYTSFEMNQKDKAAETMDKFLKLIDKDKIIASDYEYYGNILLYKNQDSLALVNYDKAIQMDSTKINLMESAAKSFDKKKKFRLAADTYMKYFKLNSTPLASQYFSAGRSCFNYASMDTTNKDTVTRKAYILRADSLFKKVAELSPATHTGNFWRARANSLLDPETKLGLAKPYYEKVAEVLATSTDPKTKRDLTEAYKYLGYFYYLKWQDASKGIEKDKLQEFKTTSADYWKKVSEIDPNDAQAKKALETLGK